MPKIKNWSRTRKNRDQTLWVHDDFGGVVSVNSLSQRELWLVEAQRGKSEEQLGIYQNRNAAEKKAVRWMKAHPRGRL